MLGCRIDQVPNERAVGRLCSCRRRRSELRRTDTGDRVGAGPTRRGLDHDRRAEVDVTEAGGREADERSHRRRLSAWARVEVPDHVGSARKRRSHLLHEHAEPRLLPAGVGHLLKDPTARNEHIENARRERAPGRIRTSDPRIRSPPLCPLSYRREGQEPSRCALARASSARRGGFEPPTRGLEVRRSVP